MQEAARRRYRVDSVREIRAGDDLLVVVDLGVSGLMQQVRVRLRGADTPSTYSIPGRDTNEAQRVVEIVRGLLGEGTAYLTEVHEARAGWLAELQVDTASRGTISVNDHLRGLGYVYEG